MARPDICKKHKLYHENPTALVQDIKRLEEEDAKRCGYEPMEWTPEKEAQVRCCPPICSFATCNHHTGHEDTLESPNPLSCRFCGQKQ